MAKSASIHTRIEPTLKEKAEKILGRLGLSASDAINLFYSQVTLHKGLPFDVKVPNARLKKSMKEVRLGRNLKSIKTVDALFDDLEN